MMINPMGIIKRICMAIIVNLFANSQISNSVENKDLISSKPIFNERFSPSKEKLSGRISNGKKIPERKIEIILMKKFAIFPTLKIIMRDAEISPSPINGIDE